ncbi:MAG TPA: OmpH family outer membrane protein [Gemmatimonadaceae bacterium]|jgi:outer membrane protein|nr:OmpH family outer membrane protein [Gemmatimonadaceae bacterium]
MNLHVRATIVAALGVALYAMPASAQATPPKVVYVNTQTLLAVAPGRAAAESTYDKESQAWSDELNKMGQDIQKMITDYQTALQNHGADSLTDAAKKNRGGQIQAKQQAYAQRQSELQTQAQDRQTELMAPVMQQVKETLETYRKEKGYEVILDAQAVVAADKNLDVTDDVVARLKIAAAAKRDSTGKPIKKQ